MSQTKYKIRVDSREQVMHRNTKINNNQYGGLTCEEYDEYECITRKGKYKGNRKECVWFDNRCTKEEEARMIKEARKVELQAKLKQYNNIKQKINKNISSINSENVKKKYFNSTLNGFTIENLNKVHNLKTKINILEKNYHVKIIKNTKQFGTVNQNYDIFSFIFGLTIKIFKDKFKYFMDNIENKNTDDLINLLQYLYNKRRQIYILDCIIKSKEIVIDQLEKYSIILEGHREHPLAMTRFIHYYRRIINNFKKYNSLIRINNSYEIAPSFKCIQYFSDGIFYNHTIYADAVYDHGMSYSFLEDKLPNLLFSDMETHKIYFYTILDISYPKLKEKYIQILNQIINLIKELKDTSENIIDIIIKIYFNFIYATIAINGTASCGEMLLYSLLESYNLNYTINTKILIDTEALTTPIYTFMYKCKNKVVIDHAFYVEGDEHKTPFLIKH